MCCNVTFLHCWSSDLVDFWCLLSHDDDELIWCSPICCYQWYSWFDVTVKLMLYSGATSSTVYCTIDLMLIVTLPWVCCWVDATVVMIWCSCFLDLLLQSGASISSLLLMWCFCYPIFMWFVELMVQLSWSDAAVVWCWCCVDLMLVLCWYDVAVVLIWCYCCADWMLMMNWSDGAVLLTWCCSWVDLMMVCVDLMLLCWYDVVHQLIWCGNCFDLMKIWFSMIYYFKGCGSLLSKWWWPIPWTWDLTPRPISSPASQWVQKICLAQSPNPRWSVCIQWMSGVSWRGLYGKMVCQGSHSKVILLIVMDS